MDKAWNSVRSIISNRYHLTFLPAGTSPWDLYIFTYIVFRSNSCQLLMETFSNLLKWAHCPLHPYIWPLYLRQFSGILSADSTGMQFSPKSKNSMTTILSLWPEQALPAQCFMNGFHNEWVWAGRLNVSWAPCWEPLSEWQWEDCCWLLTALGVR